MHFTLKMFSGKWEQNIRRLIKSYIFWFYSKCPSSFWLSYSSLSCMSKIIHSHNVLHPSSPPCKGFFYQENIFTSNPISSQPAAFEYIYCLNDLQLRSFEPFLQLYRALITRSLFLFQKVPTSTPLEVIDIAC